MEKIRLETERLILTEWGKTQKEINCLLKNFNNENVSKSLSNPPFPYTKDDALKFLNSRKEAKEKDDYVFKIVKKKDKSIIGNINLTCKKAQRRAEFGYWICQEEWGKGYATEALKAVLEFGFAIGLHKIIGRHYKDNPASGCVMKKCGLFEEGLQKEQAYKNGVYHDIVLMGIINKKEK